MMRVLSLESTLYSMDMKLRMEYFSTQMHSTPSSLLLFIKPLTTIHAGYQRETSSLCKDSLTKEEKKQRHYIFHLNGSSKTQALRFQEIEKQEWHFRSNESMQQHQDKLERLFQLIKADS